MLNREPLSSYSATLVNHYKTNHKMNSFVPFKETMKDDGIAGVCQNSKYNCIHPPIGNHIAPTRYSSNTNLHPIVS